MLGVFPTRENYQKSRNACHFVAIRLDLSRQDSESKNRRSFKLSFPSELFRGSWGLSHRFVQQNIVARNIWSLFGVRWKHFCPSLSLYWTSSTKFPKNVRFFTVF